MTKGTVSDSPERYVLCVCHVPSDVITVLSQVNVGLMKDGERVSEDPLKRRKGRTYVDLSERTKDDGWTVLDCLDSSPKFPVKEGRDSGRSRTSLNNGVKNIVITTTRLT